MLPLLNSLPNPSFAVPTSSGPTSDSEAEVLWKEGEEAIHTSRFQDAVNLLQRYVDRYPGKPHFFKAQLYLGKALVATHREKQAIPILSGFLATSQNSTDSAEARVELSRAYLNLRKYSESYLASKEAEQILEKTRSNPNLEVETLLVKSQALFGLNRKSQALQTLEAAEKKITSQTNLSIQGQTYQLQLNAKIQTCRPLNLHEVLDESQIRYHLNRRGGCLLESLLIFKKNLETSDIQSVEIASNQLIKAFESYHQVCSHPPKSHSANQSARIIAQYQKELSDILTRDCEKISVQAVDLLDSWKKNIPPSTQPYASDLSKNISKLISRNS